MDYQSPSETDALYLSLKVSHAPLEFSSRCLKSHREYRCLHLPQDDRTHHTYIGTLPFRRGRQNREQNHEAQRIVDLIEN